MKRDVARCCRGVPADLDSRPAQEASGRPFRVHREQHREECLGCPSSKLDIETNSLPAVRRIPGKRDSQARDKRASSRPISQLPFGGDQRTARNPANAAYFLALREISALSETRGGGGSRPRTGLSRLIPC